MSNGRTRHDRNSRGGSDRRGGDRRGGGRNRFETFAIYIAVLLTHNSHKLSLIKRKKNT